VVQREVYLLELARYVVLNPVRAKLVNLPEEWPWSSYRSIIGSASKAPWLDTHSTLTAFDSERTIAVAAYRNFVSTGIGEPSPLLKTKHQLILGDDDYIHQVQLLANKNDSPAIAKVQRRAMAKSLEAYAMECNTQEEAMAKAYHSTVYTMEQIGAHFGVSSKTVSRAIKKRRID